MPRKRKVTNFGDRCRFCLASDACMSQLFDEHLKSKLDDLEKCSAIEIKDRPNFPKRICYICLYKLEMWSDFKLQFIKTNKKLYTRFKIVETPPLLANKTLGVVSSADDSILEDEQKRRKIVDKEIQTSPIFSEMEISREKLPLNTTLDITTKLSSSSPLKSSANSTMNLSLESPSKTLADTIKPMVTIHSDETLINEIHSLSKSQLSDASNASARKSSRNRKFEREASTKRWVERKNALLAATGEIPSESESENDSQLSPVQKARARINNVRDAEKQNKALQKALKNLQTDMTEKYKVNPDDIFINEQRKTRSRRSNPDDEAKSPVINNTSKLPKSSPVKSTTMETKADDPATDKRNREQKGDKVQEKDQNIQREKESLKEPVEASIKETTAKPEEEPLEESSKELVKEPITESTKVLGKELSKKSVKETTKITEKEAVKESKDEPEKISVKESENKSEKESEKGINEKSMKDLIEKEKMIEVNQRLSEDENDDDSIDVRDDEPPIVITENDSHSADSDNGESDIEIVEVDNEIPITPIVPEEKTEIFTPQIVKSEIVLGNTTYIVTTTLDMPNSLNQKADISLKNNGLNIDTANQNSKKIDLMNAVELQKTANDNSSVDEKNKDVEKCLKIEIEGMEVEALQRIQLELAKFVKEDVQKRLLDKPPNSEPDIRTLKFKDTYETLDHQLKSIIEKVLRNNYESRGFPVEAISNHKRISHEFIEAAKESPVFQPRVVLNRMKIGQIYKNYSINNIHILEKEKRQRGLVGPLSRTLGKRRCVLPKKYSDYAVSFKSAIEEEKPKFKTLFKPAIVKSIPLPDSETITIDDNSDDITADIDMDRNGDIPDDDWPMDTETLSVEKITEEEEKREEGKMKENEKEKEISKTTPLFKTLKSTVTQNSTPTTKITDTLLKPLPSIGSRNTPLKIKTPAAMIKQIPPKPTTPKPLTTTATTTVTKISQSKPAQKNRERHICGICGKELFSKEEAEAHVKNHKLDSVKVSSPPKPQVLPTTLTPKPKPKPKLMRCKRCQAIVEAKNVKSHACNSVKYNCTLCECSFGAEHLLIAHIETHTHSKEKINAKKMEIKTKSPVKDKRMIILSDKINDLTGETEDDIEEMLANKAVTETYSCFVCDKTFIDEDEMKDHLQMHCEEIGDSEDKGFQCAFCGDKFQTEESLETHVGEHLQENEDEKINMLINMEPPKRDKQKRTIFKCEQCSETFASSLQLAMHLPLHEEDDQNLDEPDHYVCTICDEIFDTSEELAEHQDLHSGSSHVCILCEKSFQSIRDLQEHVSTHL